MMLARDLAEGRLGAIVTPRWPTPEVEKFDFQASTVLGLGGRAGFRLGAEECEPVKGKGTV